MDPRGPGTSDRSDVCRRACSARSARRGGDRVAACDARGEEDRVAPCGLVDGHSGARGEPQPRQSWVEEAERVDRGGSRGLTPLTVDGLGEVPAVVSLVQLVLPARV